MTAKPFYSRKKILVAAGACALAFLGCFYGQELWHKIITFYQLITDREKIETFVVSFGFAAPAVFIIIQVLQVLLAPFPGEATGFVGGFLFGTAKGFLYSSIGLTVGSWVNFLLGRLLGKRYVRKMIPDVQLARMDSLLKHQGIIVVFVLFVFPGFPKDYLCLFLGLSTIPMKVFMILATVGRMPGTLMLSLQGASAFEQRYGWFVLILGACLAIIYLAYRYRENLYQWVERFNTK